MKKVKKIRKSTIKSEKAITLVALAVTIIVILVLAGVAISLSMKNNGIISRGELSVEGNKLASYKEKLEMYKAEKIMEDKNLVEESLSAGKNTLEYNTKKEIGGTILNIIPELNEKYIDKLEIIKGKIFLTSTDKKEVQAAKIAGIEFNPYKIEDGVLESADTNLELMSPDGTLTIPSNVTKIGSGAFINTYHAKVEIDNENTKFQIENEVLYSDNKTVLVCPLYKISGKFKVIDSVKKIEDYALYEQREMTEIELSNNIEVLKDGFLCRCSKITKIEIPNTIKEINAKCFNECMNLAQVIIHKKKGEIANAPWGISKGERVIKYDE